MSVPTKRLPVKTRRRLGVFNVLRPSAATRTENAPATRTLPRRASRRVIRRNPNAATTIRFAKGAHLERVYRGRDEASIRAAAAPELAALNAAGFAVIEERLDTSIDPGAALVAGKFIALLPREIALRITIEARRTARVGALPRYHGPRLSSGTLLRGMSIAYYGAVIGIVVAAVASIAPIITAIAGLFGDLGL